MTSNGQGGSPVVTDTEEDGGPVGNSRHPSPDITAPQSRRRGEISGVPPVSPSGDQDSDKPDAGAVGEHSPSKAGKGPREPPKTKAQLKGSPLTSKPGTLRRSTRSSKAQPQNTPSSSSGSRKRAPSPLVAQKRSKKTKKSGTNAAAAFSKPTAEKEYSKAEQAKLTAAFKPICNYCQFRAPQCPHVRRHLLTSCPEIQRFELIALVGLWADSACNGLPDDLCVSKFVDWKHPVPFMLSVYEAAELNGLATICTMSYPDKVAVAPYNYLLVQLDANKCNGQKALRVTMDQGYFRHRTDKSRRRILRRYSDYDYHMQWQEKMKSQLANKEVDVLALPILFYYVNEKTLKDKDHKNHAALLLVERIGTSTEFTVTYYDSVPKDYLQYYNKGTSISVKRLLTRLLSTPKLPTITEGGPYKSLAVDGCQSVVAHWLFQLMAGKKLSDPTSKYMLMGWQQMLANFPVTKETNGDIIDTMYVYAGKFRR